MANSFGEKDDQRAPLSSIAAQMATQITACVNIMIWHSTNKTLKKQSTWRRFFMCDQKFSTRRWSASTIDLRH
jgi:hypothetical protein